jgi:sugar transferase EpsL
MLKRSIDVLGSALGLVAIAPVWVAVAVAVRFTMGSPVLFRQVRSGLREMPFVLYKFRTMRDSKGPDGALLSDAERLTRLGAFLRSTSLDELPQLWNVLRGDMSLVGPRPLLPEYLSLYTPEQARRHEVKPGITGWNAVNGRNSMTWGEQFEMDVWYVDHQSFLLDFKILLLTVVKVLKRDGVTQVGHVTRERFQGGPMQNFRNEP